jgi:hypothetical protein
VHAALAELHEVGAVRRRGGNAPVWTAEPAGEVVRRLRARRMREASAASRHRVHADAVRGAREQLGDGVRHLPSRETARRRLAALIAVERHEQLAINTEQAFDAESARAAAPLDRSLMARGIRLRVLGLPPADRDLHVGPAMLDTPHCGYREADELPMKLIVVDRRVAFFASAATRLDLAVSLPRGRTFLLGRDRTTPRTDERGPHAKRRNTAARTGRHQMRSRTWGWAFAATAVMATVAAGAPAGATDRGGARVTGSAEFVLPYGQDQDVRSFAFDARSVPWSRPIPVEGGELGSPADATGTVRVEHYVAADQVTVRFEAAVDCLITSPGHASLTAIVTRADGPARDFLGKRVGFSVQDGGHGRDRVGFTWSASVDQNEAGEWGLSRIGTCLSPGAFAPVTRGDYRIRHAELTAPPAGR